MTMAKTIYSIPNLLSLLRLALVPVLALTAAQGQANWFLVLLAVSLLSDMLDGYFARKLQQTSELGARLDSWADMLTYAAMILGIYLLWPIIFEQQKIFLLAATLSYILPVMLALSRFGSFPSYHTWGAKLAAVLLAPAFYLLILADNQLFFRAVIVFHAVVAIEEIAITFILKRPRTNVSSIITLLSGKSKTP